MSDIPPPNGLYGGGNNRSSYGRQRDDRRESRYSYNRDNSRRDRRNEPYRHGGNRRYNNRRDGGGGRFGQRDNDKPREYENPQVKKRRIEKEKLDSDKRRAMFKASSRWHEDDSQYSHVVPPFPTFIPSGLPPKALKAFLIRARLDEIERRMQIGLIVNKAEMREPSPPPTFDNTGRRTNTRIQRLEERLNEERSRLVEEAFKINPTFQPPAGFKFTPKKFLKRLPVPVDKYPDYNFIGLIIGPRGSTQKRLEEETGAKIAIRGKGSVKGVKALTNPHSNEPLHVLITAEDKKTLHRAVQVIEKLLIPVEEGQNEFKRQQLRELAKIHGTLREEEGPLRHHSSIVTQLEKYGQRNPEDRSEQHRHNRYGHNQQSSFDTQQQPMEDEEKDEVFERFVQELEGKTQELPFYKFYVKQVDTNNDVNPPGTEDFSRGHYMYNIELSRQKKKGQEELSAEDKKIARHFGFENSAVVEFGEDDPDFECSFMDHPVAPPGTLEEEILEGVMEERERVEKKEEKKRRQRMREGTEVEEEREEKTLKEVMKKKKRIEKQVNKKKQKKEMMAGDIPPWEMEDSSSEEEDFVDADL